MTVCGVLRLRSPGVGLCLQWGGGGKTVVFGFRCKVVVAMETASRLRQPDGRSRLSRRAMSPDSTLRLKIITHWPSHVGELCQKPYILKNRAINLFISHCTSI